MEFDAFLLSRIQFAVNITFHILFPSITIALGWVLLFFKYCHQKTKNKKWMNIYFFWTKIFALCFAIGVVSGIVMPFQFGTNWPGFMETFGNIAGPLLGYEVLTAFFLEATFLSVMLFGFKRVSPWLHNLATFLVALGTTLSAFWILALNSWMQTPVGFEMINGQAYPTDWLAIIFNPSFPYRFFHKLVASGLTVAFLIAGISAYRCLRNHQSESALSSLKVGVYLAAILIPIQIVIGDLHGINTFKHQPAKFAAIEAIWETQEGAPLTLIGFPDEKNKTSNAIISIPKGLSILATHSLNGKIQGLNEFPNHPPVAAVFWSFRIMVGVGILMLIISWISAWMIRKNQLPSWLLKSLVMMTFSGWIAVISGWYTTEIGRQPWIVQDVLKTKDTVSSLAPSMVGLTLTLYLIVYAVLLVAFISTIFYMAKHKYKD